MKNWLYLLVVVVFVQSLVIVGLASASVARGDHLDLMRENQRLHALVRERTDMACAVRIQLGAAYKVALQELMDHLGLLKGNPYSPVEAVLTAYEAGGVGGADE